MLALEAQGKKDDAALIRTRFDKVWKDADYSLSPARTGTH
jgi:hypothetical protein